MLHPEPSLGYTRSKVVIRRILKQTIIVWPLPSRHTDKKYSVAVLFITVDQFTAATNHTGICGRKVIHVSVVRFPTEAASKCGSAVLRQQGFLVFVESTSSPPPGSSQTKPATYRLRRKLNDCFRRKMKTIRNMMHSFIFRAIRSHSHRGM